MAENIQVNFSSKKTERILPFRKTDSNWGILTIHYSSIPNYDFKAASQGLSYEGIQQELEISWEASSGKRVYPEFSREHHIAVEPLEYNVNKPLYIGLDFGGCPACVFTQLNSFGQWLIFPSISPPEESSLGVWEFGEIIKFHLIQEYAIPNNKEVAQLKLVFFGDPAGQGPPARVGDSPKELRSCFDILYKGLEIQTGIDEFGNKRVVKKPGFGWRVLPGKVGISDRLESVKARLTTTLKDGLPALVVDPRAEVVKEGFLGGYHYKQSQDGRYDYKPYKDFYSHTFDALGYVGTRLFSQSTKDEDDDEDFVRPTEFCSMAASRYG